MKTNKDITMNMLITLIRFNILENVIDFPYYLVWSSDVKRYSLAHGVKDQN